MTGGWLGCLGLHPSGLIKVPPPQISKKHQYQGIFFFKEEIWNRIHGTNGIFIDIYHKNQLKVGKYTIHGSVMGYGILFDGHQKLEVLKHSIVTQLLISFPGMI